MRAINLTKIFALGQTDAIVRYGGNPPRMKRDEYRAMLLDLREPCEALRLESTLRQIDRTLGVLDGIDPSDGETAVWQAIKPHLDQLSIRYQEETEGAFAYHLGLQEHNLYNNPTKDWQDVLANFPSGLSDIQEMGKCFALGRYTAAVFHAMRVLEPGLTALGREFSVSTTMNTWKTIIDKLRKAIEAKSIAEGSKWKNRDFYSEVAAQIWFFKDAWRNHVMHARVTFTEETAAPVIDYTRRFMSRLAEKLSE